MTAAARDQHVNGTAPPHGGGVRRPRWDPGFDTSPASPDAEASEATQQVDTSGAAPAAAATPVPDAPAAPAGVDPPPVERRPSLSSADVPAVHAGPRTGGDGDGGGLSSARLLRPVKRAPRSGWRAALFSATGGLVNMGESEQDAARRELSDRARTPLTGCYRVVALSQKGGTGKSTTTAGLGSAFASLRGDRVVALDANPDRGNLVEKVPRETTATVRALLDDAHQIRRAADVRNYTNQGPSRLEVLASEADPAASEEFSAADYHAAVDLLSQFYDIVLTDAGTGISNSALGASLEVADSLLIVTTASIDGLRAAESTIKWLAAHGHAELLARSVTVINRVPLRRSVSVDLDAAESYFAAHSREVVRVPFDPELDVGAEIDLDRLASRTRDALLTLAAVVADDFARPGRIEGGARRRTPALLPSTSDGQW